MKNKKMRLRILLLCAAVILQGFAAAETAETYNFAKRLNELGYCALADTSSAEDICAAVGNFQIANGLVVTGEADEATLAALQSEEAVSQTAYLTKLTETLEGIGVLASGSYGEPVERLQKALRDLGYFEEECDGSYGDTTEFAVNRFQLANGLVETGIADRTVLYRLYNGAAATWDEFVAENTASVGDEGENVRMLQIWLKHMGCFDGECTSVYGEQTRRAVKRYQNDIGLEATGNVDAETADALFMDAARALSAGATVRRGDSGSRALEMCEKLRVLGYPAHETFDYQTELALMRFQLANGLDVTGAADSATMASIRLQTQDGTPAVIPEAEDPGAIDEEVFAAAARQAAAMLGQPAEFDDDFAFVQYVFLKCGVPLPSEAAVGAIPLPEDAPPQTGKAVCVTADGAQLWGIATADGALILCGGDYIVMRYLNAMNVEQVCVAGSML